MSEKIMHYLTVQRPFLVGMILAIFTCGLSSHALAGHHARHAETCDSRQSSCESCPNCRYRCKLEAEEGETEKTTFEVESEVICIPKVVFPWQKKSCTPCANNGACLKRVKKLVKGKRKCPKCEYTWTAEKTECATSSCGGGCRSGGAHVAGEYDSVVGDWIRSDSDDMVITSPVAASPTSAEVLDGRVLNGRANVLEPAELEPVVSSPRAAKRFWIPRQAR